MVTVIPSARSPLDVIMEQVGGGLSQTLPGAMQQMGQRQRGQNALAQAEKDIAAAGNDPMKLALAFARMQIASPEAAKGMAPVFSTALQQSQAARAYDEANKPQNLSGGQIKVPEQPGIKDINYPQPEQQPLGTFQSLPKEYATPGPFNIMTAPEMDAESKRYAKAVAATDPNGYATRMAQLTALNNAATTQRQNLEKMALDSNISAEDLPRFMNVASEFDVRNPTEWMQKAKRKWMEVKSNDEKMQTAFVPGPGSALFGKDRNQALKKLTPTVQEQVKNGQEQETRNFLADQYLTPTEIAEQIHPLKPEKLKEIQGLPKGLFPLETPVGGFAKAGQMPLRGTKQKGPIISYEEAVERAPKELQQMQDQLANWFLKNLDKETSILAVRDKLVHDKDYDWRQVGPAVRQAERMGLKLEPFQSTEMPEVETQAPYDSLPEIFQDLDRIIKYQRGGR